jgi:hypothetical protein
MVRRRSFSSGGVEVIWIVTGIIAEKGPLAE